MGIGTTMIVRLPKILDGLLTYARVNDPTAAGGAGQPPKHLRLGSEGKADVKDGGDDRIVAELNGRVRCRRRAGLTKDPDSWSNGAVCVPC